MNRPALQALAIGAMATSALLLVTRSVHHPEPERAAVERLVGVAFETLTYHPAPSPLQRARRTARFFWMALTMPIPNQMAFWHSTDTWTYSFETSPGYRPPPDSPLVCEKYDGVLTCRAQDERGWQYDLRTSESGGLSTLVVSAPVPRGRP